MVGTITRPAEWGGRVCRRAQEHPFYPGVREGPEEPGRLQGQTAT
jgi:hypothetical protein